eukprot:TRINITY_DN74212_c0_g1_i1.p1 TRINITY_DN74212_c0_g1~~TRINITY_DN74212_c0_g1_i1.p1  ORF type:complete len:744 (-),score=185.12 TRINITY_DN74212_c0_g1_i1:195-2426(-)
MVQQSLGCDDAQCPPPKRARLETAGSLSEDSCFTPSEAEWCLGDAGFSRSSSGDSASSSTEASVADKETKARRTGCLRRSKIPKPALDALQRFVVKRVDELRRRGPKASGSRVKAGFCWEAEAITSERHLASLLRRLCRGAAGPDDRISLGEVAAQRVVAVASLSAQAAMLCRAATGAGRQASLAAVEAQQLLEQQLAALSKCEGGVAVGLARQLGDFCWHTAWERMWKWSLGRLRPNGCAAAEDDAGAEAKSLVGGGSLEFQRRIDELRALLAADAARDWHEGDKLQPHSQGDWRGANIGGWLVWEKGPCNSAEVVKAVAGKGEEPWCEWDLSRKLRDKYGDDKALELMKRHRATYVTRETFERIAARGLNAVRIPIGYWLFTGPRQGEPFLGPDVEPLDNAFRWAAELNLKVVLSMHGNVGFQSDHQASGRYGNSWQASDWNPEETIDVLRTVAGRYAGHPALGGIAVTNEPSHMLPLDDLRNFYRDAYWAVRKAGITEDVQVIMPIFHRDAADFFGRFSEKDGFKNVLFDVHVYHVFGEDWHTMSLADHLRYATAEEGHDVTSITQGGEKVVVGEWCIALPIRDWCYTVAWEWLYLTKAEKNAVRRSMAMRQLSTFAKHTRGWFFWSWRDEDSVEWCMEDCLKEEYLPDFAGEKAPGCDSGTLLTSLKTKRPSQHLKMPGEAARWYRGEEASKRPSAVATSDRKNRSMQCALEKTASGLAAWRRQESKRLRDGRRARRSA